MGQQQLLLIVLGAIIVGLGIVIGLSLFRNYAIDTKRNNVMNDCVNLAAIAQQYYMLWEGDEVYLGYLTKINYENNTVAFVLNKGGIIEKVQLQLEKEEKAREKKK